MIPMNLHTGIILHADTHLYMRTIETIANIHTIANLHMRTIEAIANIHTSANLHTIANLHTGATGTITNLHLAVYYAAYVSECMGRRLYNLLYGNTRVSIYTTYHKTSDHIHSFFFDYLLKYINFSYLCP